MENYEEKYKEMKKRVLAIGQGYVKEVDYSSPRSIAEYIDPDLKESEDERIRNFLINFIKVCGWTEKKGQGWPLREECIAWLEKQGDTNKWKPSEDEMGALYGLAYLTNKMDDKKDEAITKLYQDLKREFFNGASYENMFPSSPVDAPIKDEKQGEQKLYMIQWKGNNLKEIVEFTGKSPKFNDWFKTWEEYENYVHTHNNIFKIFNEDGSHVEVPVGAWIIKTPDGYNVASRYVFKQKSADKVEPKFKVGDYMISNNNSEIIYHITGTGINELGNPDYVCEHVGREKEYNGKIYNMSQDKVDANFRLWTIQDAKDGDILCSNQIIVLFKQWEDNTDYSFVIAHAGIDVSSKLQITNEHWLISNESKPANKEQRDLLFQKMKKEGYEWDAEKKELKKIEQSCNNSDGLYYAIDILEKTLGKVEGYQSDDGKREHQIAIETVNALYHKKPAEWSEEDEEMFDAVIADIQFTQKAHNHEINQVVYEREIDWLKSIKDRVQPQPKQEWDEANNSMIEGIKIAILDYYDKENADEIVSWLESLKERVQPQPKYQWKPSKEQMEALNAIIGELSYVEQSDLLVKLYNDLKKL